MYAAGGLIGVERSSRRLNPLDRDERGSQLSSEGNVALLGVLRGWSTGLVGGIVIAQHMIERTKRRFKGQTEVESTANRPKTAAG